MVLQPNPELVVHVSAFEAPEQEGIASAVGAADEAVPFPSTVFPAIAGSMAVVRAQ
jgi:hypothetical protein